MQKGVAKAGGMSHQSIPCKGMHGKRTGILRPPYIIAPAEHFPPSFSFLKKETHGRLLLFERAKLFTDE